MALRRTTLPAPNVVLTLAVLGATCRGSTVIQRGPLVLRLLLESSLQFAKLNREAVDLYTAENNLILESTAQREGCCIVVY